MVRLLEIQERLKHELAAAIEGSDSAELNRLILKAEKLEMGAEPVVVQGKEVREGWSVYGLPCLCCLCLCLCVCALWFGAWPCSLH